MQIIRSCLPSSHHHTHRQVCIRLLYFIEILQQVRSIQQLGEGVIYGCDRLLTTVDYNEDYDGDVCNDVEVNQWLMQQHVIFPNHQACSSTSITPQGIEACIQEHGNERATEIDDQQMTALPILCVNPYVTGDAIRDYLTLAPQAGKVQDSTGMA